MMPLYRAGRTGQLLLLLLLLAALSPITTPRELRARESSSSFIRFEKEPGCLALADSGRCTPWLISSTDWPGVHRVAENVRRDLLKVSGAMPPLCVDSLSGSGECVIIGTLGKSLLLDRLIAAKKLDLTGVAGQWESSVTQVVEEPLPGIRRALVIAGSDKRGTIYGLYQLAARIGVSAWHFWSDVPPQPHQSLYVVPGRHTLGAPRVKYRGIFINDEAPALNGWAFAKFGGFNSRFYEHVFDLILRLKGNYLWPAMWGRMFYVEDPLNPQLADEYGVVIATSHHEPMMRAHAEWARFGTGKWNYEANAGVLQQFWREGIERMGKYESVVTVGMRGDGDEPMSEAANIALLERIVRDQRQIIAEVTGKPAEATPQVWALYKEVQEYYDRGMRVPDDVTLLLCDDNWGNIRKLPRPDDPPRRGGYGIYYHFDYVGDPRNYKWLNTNQISRTWEQMHLAWEMGARQIWIVNVGDIKPMELPTEFFLDYAWDPEAWPAERLGDYTRQWAARQFGPGEADEIAALLKGYTRCNSRRKPELLAPETYSLTGHNEAERVAAEYQALAERSQRLYDRLPGSQRDAYYQLVHHPVTACANLKNLYLTVAKNRLYASQGRALTNALADSAAALFARDAAISRYYNQELAGGKWSHMMDQTHIGYTYWQQPDSNAMPAVERIALPDAAEMGVSVEGASLWWPDAAGEALLPEIDPYIKPGCWLEVFNRGAAPFMANIHSSKKWLHAGPGRIRITGESRIFISADWSRVPPGRSQAAITITGPGGRRIVVRARLHQPEAPAAALAGRFLESNGAAAIEAAHYSRAENRHGLYWQEIPELGRTLSGMTLFPVDAAPADMISDAPCLEYALHWFSAGPVTLRAFLSPTLNFHHGQGLRCAMALNDEAPQIINIHQGMEWDKWVSDNIVVVTAAHEITRPGAQRLRFWALDPGVVLQRLVVERPDAPATYLGPPETRVPSRVPPQQPQGNPEAAASKTRL